MERRDPNALLPPDLRPRRATRRGAPAAAGNDPTEEGSPMRREPFTTPESIRLDLRVPAGEIDVQAGDTTETSVELEPIGGAESTSAVEEARLELRDGILVVDVPEQRGIRIFSRGPEVRLAV